MKRIIQGADRDLTDCIGECARNILKGNVTLKPSEKARLTKYKLKLGRRATLKSRKKVLQTGGFLPALLGPLLGSVIIPLAKKSRWWYYQRCQET